jgi:hypothetical protein
MKYQPNWCDPRIIKRVKQAYGFARGCMSEHKPHRWAKTVINKHFGQSQHPLSKYLRSVLLITTNHRYSMNSGLTKEYLLNQNGAAFIKAQLKKPDNSLIWSTQYEEEWSQPEDQFYDQEFGDELTFDDQVPERLWDEDLVLHLNQREFARELRDADFQYVDKSNRLWHPIQNLRSQYRTALLNANEYQHHYDIDTAAPKLLYEFSMMHGNDLWPPALRDYIKNKNVIRQHIADDVGISLKDTKVIINALFCGAKLACNPQSSLFQQLKCDKNKMIKLRNNRFICELRCDIKEMWNTLGDPKLGLMTRRRHRGGRLMPLTSTDKWSLYFRLERQVMDAVSDYIKITNFWYDRKNHSFFIHDGWACKLSIDINACEDFVRSKTGLSITFSKSVEVNLPQVITNKHSHVINNMEREVAINHLASLNWR